MTETLVPPLRILPAGLALIRQAEGLRLAAYRCPAGIWTVGYGHTHSAWPGRRISAAEADRLLAEDLFAVERDLAPLLRVAVSDTQWSALVSFAFNVGIGALARSTLLSRVNARDFAAVPAELMRWTKGGGRTLPGLERRRAAEAALWSTSPAGVLA